MKAFRNIAGTITTTTTTTIICAFGLLTACAGQPTSSLARQCKSGLNKAYIALDEAEAKGFGGSVSYMKASGLLAGAKVQQQFGKYPNCVDKVKRARYYIKQASLGNDS